MLNSLSGGRLEVNFTRLMFVQSFNEFLHLSEINYKTDQKSYPETDQMCNTCYTVRATFWSCSNMTCLLY